jgi:hypothetical protein
MAFLVSVAPPFTGGGSVVSGVDCGHIIVEVGLGAAPGTPLLLPDLPRRVSLDDLHGLVLVLLCTAILRLILYSGVSSNPIVSAKNA